MKFKFTVIPIIIFLLGILVVCSFIVIIDKVNASQSKKPRLFTPIKNK